MDLSPHHVNHPTHRMRAGHLISAWSCLAGSTGLQPQQPDEFSAIHCGAGGRRVLLVDRCTLFRAGLTLLLQQFDPQLQVMQTSDDSQAMRCLRAWGPCDLVLLAVALPSGCGLDGLRDMHLHWPSMPILALLGNGARGLAAAALGHGATACVAQDSTPEQLKQVVFRLLAGSADGRNLPPPAAGGEGGANRSACPALHITPRQADVLRLMCLGLSTKRICRELGLAQSTVKTHTHAVFHALQVSSRVQAVIAVGAWAGSARAASSLGLRDRHSGSGQTGTGTRPAVTAPRPGPGSVTEVSYEYAG